VSEKKLFYTLELVLSGPGQRDGPVEISKGETN